MTERLYYSDSFLSEFRAVFLGWSEDGAALLDRTAFYPESGGQDSDTGFLDGVRVLDVQERDTDVLHLLEQPFDPRLQPGSSVKGSIDWLRRFDLMQQHTGQHLLSAVALDLFGWQTASVHLGVGSATVEFATSQATPEELALLERRVNEQIAANHPVTASICAPGEEPVLRKAVVREGPLRVVTIHGIDQSACGGTHVGSTAQIGGLLLGSTERIRKQVRVEFACGLRAMHRAAEQRDLLSRAAATLQCHPLQLPQLVARQREELLQLSKREKALARDLASWCGREARTALLVETPGLCCAVRWVPENPGEPERAYATAFCEAPDSVLLTLCATSGAFLLCAHAGSGFDALAWLHETASALGAKGGGSPAMVSGRLADPSLAPALPGLLPAPAVTLPG